MYEKRVKYKAKVGDRVLIKNHRSKLEKQEWATVKHVDVSIDPLSKEGFRVRYNLLLDRKSSNGNMWLYIGESQIVDVQIGG